MRESQKIGELVVVAYGKRREYEISYATGYGVICPGLLTSNGSLALVAQAVEIQLDIAQFKADIPDFSAALEISGRSVVCGNVATALKAAVNSLAVPA
jgi:hypothetical protein